ncbi:TPA: Flp family type IVb pilin [Vibrio vulnificus]|uniref:Flp family type IVb pilin n=1 Tax=Vibrio vulnificus TaxID=672 RepID=UPI000722A2F3|nr:Flp family type IVb pilin [Vibrio vulnificus]ALM72986.1 Flp pilus assembly protein, pilin Flp [Vibrio vulnificus]ANH65347.1 Flp pilus assembly protein, pilin Flp [Vibrio vulnificus]EGQ8092757.1 Flp family type IVb pilin [Vibrio vulnificus]EHH0745201.1 Flp family type IVb pilin [Vibrio vulnificus]ELV8677147.1 Flp family type IVb pilin [Vibrio vulnificus]
MFNKVMTKAIEWKLNLNQGLRSLNEDKRGVTAVEYAIIAVAMSAIILFVFKDGTLKQTLNNAMTTISSKMTEAGTVSGTGGAAGGGAAGGGATGG